MAKIPKAYLASQFGFSETGKHLIDMVIKPRIFEECAMYINDPFAECGKLLDLKFLTSLERYEDRANYLREFSAKVAPTNNALMRDSDCFLGILDGGHAIDDGVASEIGFYAGIERGPIFALRTDIRCGENIAVPINPQVLGYVCMSKGSLESSMNGWIHSIRKWRGSLTQCKE